MKFIFYLILFYFLYRLIFDFIIPVSRTTRQIKRKINEVHEQQQRYQRQRQEASQPQQQQQVKRQPEPDSGDYIEYEEVKP
ncbi:MAG TPA: hypothetical protein VF145_06320 [Chitinophagaceae bacterium]